MALGRSIWDDIRTEMSSGNMVTRLIMVNAVVFIAINLVYVSGFFYFADKISANNFVWKVIGWLGIPAELKLMLKRPWVIITHMFSHLSFFHFLFNMLGLYWFGGIVKEFIGNKKILPLYLMGGIAGAALLVAFFYFFPSLRPSLPAIGASAGVLAIIIAAATIVPDYTVFLVLFGPVKIKWIAVALVVIDLVSIPEQNTGGHIAHLGGALFGFIYIRQLQLGSDLAAPFIAIYDAFVAFFKPKPKTRVAYKRTTVPPTTAKPKSAKQDAGMNKQARIDSILDKISNSGYDSLSKEEKDFLFKVSKED
jgi:membrane associated rhomboid family serine protease